MIFVFCLSCFCFIVYVEKSCYFCNGNNGFPFVNLKLHKCMNEKERIELIMKSYNLTPSQFADRAGIQRASVSHILSGRNKASLEVLLKIYDSFPGLDMAWLMTGKGNAPVSIAEEPVVEEKLQLTIPELFQPRQPEPAGAKGTSESEPEQLHKGTVARSIPAERSSRRTSATRSASQVNASPAVRKIKEIRVFYTDGTYETMIPEK